MFVHGAMRVSLAVKAMILISAVVISRIIMENKNKSIDPLPDSFATEEEAGAFWDAHSTIDYEEYWEPAEDVIAIRDRVFEVQVAEDVFQSYRRKRQPCISQCPESLIRSCESNCYNPEVATESFERNGVE
jgi:hypothetical protein